MELARALRAAADYLAVAAPAIDAINVYPVPDGDTGSNMAATLRAAVAAIGDESNATVVLRAVAKGALYGARGNSGVILSQALRGIAAADGNPGQLGPADVSLALARAADAAYASMSQPQEGTMLTVLRAAADTAQGDDALSVLRSALSGAEEAERKTIDQLERLREAGVTDAGGEGICTILRAVVASLAEEPLPELTLANAPLARLVDHGEEYGFCTEFLVEAAGGPLDLSEIRMRVEAGDNRSAIVVGDGQLVRVHVHTDEPERLLERARSWGSVSAVKVEDMGRQNVAMRARQATVSGAGLLAICEGAGFADAFQSLGASVLRHEPGQRPSVQQIVAALASFEEASVYVLPNHKDVVPVARQAAELWDGNATVVPSLTLPEGLAAAVSFDGDGESDAVQVAMMEAASSVETIECTVATDSRTADGVPIAKGEVVVLVDGKAVAAAASLTEGLLAGLARTSAGDGSLVTVYTGIVVNDELEGELERATRAAVPGAEVEMTRGGQGLYPVIASVE